jgi:hypothetical protein
LAVAATVTQQTLVALSEMAQVAQIRLSLGLLLLVAVAVAAVMGFKMVLLVVLVAVRLSTLVVLAERRHHLLRAMRVVLVMAGLMVLVVAAQVS